MSVGPPDAVGDVVERHAVGPAQLLRDDLGAVGAVHADTPDERGQAPVSPEHVAEEHMLLIMNVDIFCIKNVARKRPYFPQCIKI